MLGGSSRAGWPGRQRNDNAIQGRRSTSVAGRRSQNGSRPEMNIHAPQEDADQGKSRTVLGLGSLGVFFDLHDLLTGTPDDQNVGSVTMPFPVMMKLESEGLLLPGIRMPGGEQDLEGFKFVLRFRVSRPAICHISDFTLHARL